MPEAETLTRNKAAGAAIGAGANLDKLIETSDYNTLVVEVDMSGAANADLVIEVSPVSEVNDEVYPILMPPVQSTGPTFVTSRVYYWGRFDVSAQNRVRLRIKNANAGAQTADWAFRMAE
jgi:hypothetical protein